MLLTISHKVERTLIKRSFTLTLSTSIFSMWETIPPALNLNTKPRTTRTTPVAKKQDIRKTLILQQQRRDPLVAIVVTKPRAPKRSGTIRSLKKGCLAKSYAIFGIHKLHGMSDEFRFRPLFDQSCGWTSASEKSMFHSSMIWSAVFQWWAKWPSVWEL